MRNLEMKAPLSDLARAREVVSKLGGRHGYTENQEDVYFKAQAGRLKLRKRSGEAAQLISYTRCNEQSVRPSDYLIAEVGDAEALEQVLSDALGVLCVVRKRREVYFVENARIHLDEVEGLGTFIEFEIVVHEPSLEPLANEFSNMLLGVFRIGRADILPESYSDMLMV